MGLVWWVSGWMRHLWAIMTHTWVAISCEPKPFFLYLLGPFNWWFHFMWTNCEPTLYPIVFRTAIYHCHSFTMLLAKAIYNKIRNYYNHNTHNPLALDTIEKQNQASPFLSISLHSPLMPNSYYLYFFCLNFSANDRTLRKN